MSHSKAPWRLEKRAAGELVILDADCDWLIATLNNFNPRMDDDAALMVAAPDLLEACEALPDFDIDNPDADEIKDCASQFRTAMRLSRAAIAKAKRKEANR